VSKKKKKKKNVRREKAMKWAGGRLGEKRQAVNKMLTK